MKRLIILLLIIFIQLIGAKEYLYESIVFHPFEEEIISKDIMVIDSKYQQATCEQQKTLFGMKECNSGSAVIKHADLIESVFVCDPIKTNMVCIISADIQFSIPYGKKIKNQTWVLRGTEFKIIEDAFEIEFRGKNVRVYVVQSRNDSGEESVYFFGEQQGLVAIYFLSKEKDYIYTKYYLSSVTGYGHK